MHNPKAYIYAPTFPASSSTLEATFHTFDFHSRTPMLACLLMQIEKGGLAPSIVVGSLCFYSPYASASADAKPVIPIMVEGALRRPADVSYFVVAAPARGRAAAVVGWRCSVDAGAGRGHRVGLGY